MSETGQAAAEYAKAAKLGVDAQNEAATLTLRAKRKAGEFLGKLAGKGNKDYQRW